MTPLRVGVVARPHGLKGEIAVTLDDPEGQTLLEPEHALVGGVKRRIVRARTGRRGQILLDLGISLEEAESLRGQEVAVDEAELPPLEKWEFWSKDLVGLSAVDAAGHEVGKVEEVVDTAEVAVLVVRGAGGERFVPLTDPYVIDVDVPGGKVVVAPLQE